MSAGGRDEERRKLADIIHHWNANRLDLFEISQPTEGFLVNYGSRVLLIFPVTSSEEGFSGYLKFSLLVLIYHDLSLPCCIGCDAAFVEILVPALAILPSALVPVLLPGFLLVLPCQTLLWMLP
ncbi:hypothetical protein H8959_018640 [Pygathrix nigripes]